MERRRLCFKHSTVYHNVAYSFKNSKKLVLSFAGPNIKLKVFTCLEINAVGLINLTCSTEAYMIRQIKNS